MLGLPRLSAAHRRPSHKAEIGMDVGGGQRATTFGNHLASPCTERLSLFGDDRGTVLAGVRCAAPNNGPPLTGNQSRPSPPFWCSFRPPPTDGPLVTPSGSFGSKRKSCTPCSEVTTAGLRSTWEYSNGICGLIRPRLTSSAGHGDVQAGRSMRCPSLFQVS